MSAERLVDAETYWQSRTNIFPTLHAYIAFKRKHKLRLMQRQALFLIEGRELVDPLHFDQVIIDIGHKQAKVGL